MDDNTKKERRTKYWENYKLELINKLPVRIKLAIEQLKEKEVLKSKKIDTKGIYLYGNNGTGKTIMSIFLTLEYIKNQYINNNHCPDFIFITVPELLLIFRDCYSKKSELSEMELLTTYSNIDILILDDFGVEKNTDWAFQMLYILINRRYENMNKTIITSNLSLSQLADKLNDDRIPSRLQQMCDIIETAGFDYRSK